MNLFDDTTIGRRARAVPTHGPMRHFVRWSPSERLAFLPDGALGVALGVEATRERCRECKGWIVHADHSAWQDPAKRFRGEVTPHWCCLREAKAVPR